MGELKIRVVNFLKAWNLRQGTLFTAYQELFSNGEEPIVLKARSHLQQQSKMGLFERKDGSVFNDIL